MLQTRNCGIGSNGFEPGNDCAKGDGTGSPDDAAKGGGGKADSDSQVDSTAEQVDSTASDLLYDIQDQAEAAGVATEWDQVLELQPDLSNTETIDFYKEIGYKILTGVTEQLDEPEYFDLRELDRGAKHYGTITNAEIQKQVQAAPESEREALKAKLKEEQQAARLAAIDGMREELETQTATAKLDGRVQLYRGVALSDEQLERIIEDGRVVHPGVNSWTAHTRIAAKFSSNTVFFVTSKAQRGIVQRRPSKSGGLEFEVIRPPSSMRIERVVRTKDGATFLYLDEDEVYKD